MFQRSGRIIGNPQQQGSSTRLGTAMRSMAPAQRVLSSKQHRSDKENTVKPGTGNTNGVAANPQGRGVATPIRRAVLVDRDTSRSQPLIPGARRAPGSSRASLATAQIQATQASQIESLESENTHLKTELDEKCKIIEVQKEEMASMQATIDALLKEKEESERLTASVLGMAHDAEEPEPDDPSLRPIQPPPNDHTLDGKCKNGVAETETENEAGSESFSNWLESDLGNVSTDGDGDGEGQLGEVREDSEVQVQMQGSSITITADSVDQDCGVPSVHEGDSGSGVVEVAAVEGLTLEDIDSGGCEEGEREEKEKEKEHRLPFSLADFLEREHHLEVEAEKIKMNQEGKEQEKEKEVSQTSPSQHLGLKPQTHNKKNKKLARPSLDSLDEFMWLEEVVQEQGDGVVHEVEVEGEGVVQVVVKKVAVTTSTGINSEESGEEGEVRTDVIISGVSDADAGDALKLNDSMISIASDVEEEDEGEGEEEGEVLLAMARLDPHSTLPIVTREEQIQCLDARPQPQHKTTPTTTHLTLDALTHTLTHTHTHRRNGSASSTISACSSVSIPQPPSSSSSSSSSSTSKVHSGRGEDEVVELESLLTRRSMNPIAPLLLSNVSIVETPTPHHQQQPYPSPSCSMFSPSPIMQRYGLAVGGVGTGLDMDGDLEGQELELNGEGGGEGEGHHFTFHMDKASANANSESESAIVCDSRSVSVSSPFIDYNLHVKKQGGGEGEREGGGDDGVRVVISEAGGEGASDVVIKL